MSYIFAKHFNCGKNNNNLINSPIEVVMLVVNHSWTRDRPFYHKKLFFTRPQFELNYLKHSSKLDSLHYVRLSSGDHVKSFHQRSDCFNGR